jgi:hypothetical protein
MHWPTPSPGGRRERWSSKLCERQAGMRGRLDSLLFLGALILDLLPRAARRCGGLAAGSEGGRRAGGAGGWPDLGPA